MFARERLNLGQAFCLPLHSTRSFDELLHQIPGAFYIVPPTCHMFRCCRNHTCSWWLDLHNLKRCFKKTHNKLEHLDTWISETRIPKILTCDSLWLDSFRSIPILNSCIQMLFLSTSQLWIPSVHGVLLEMPWRCGLVFFTPENLTAFLPLKIGKPGYT